MLDFLGTPWGFGSVVTVCFALVFIIWRVGYIAFAKWGLIIGKETKKVSPHATCPHAKDIMEIIHRTSEYYEKIHSLKDSIIEDQMRAFEEIEEEVVGHLKHGFINLIMEKLGPNEQFMDNQDYSYYNIIIKVISQDIKSYVRSCFKTNHYISYDLDEQLAYIDKKKILIVQKVTEALNLYWRGSSISRSDIYKKNKDNIKFYEKSIEDIFNKAFSLSRETHDRIEKLDKEYNDYINLTVGSDK